MNTYALVSAVGPDIGRCWCTLAASQLHTGAVENFLRANALAGHTFLQRIADSELNVRTEWMRYSQTNNNTPLTEVITTVAQNHSLWPLVSEFKPYRENRRPQNPIRNVGGKPAGDRKGGKKGGKGLQDAAQSHA